MIAVIQKYADASSAVKLAASLERLVRDGRCAADSLLPPLRDLAVGLGISPGTAAAAYKVLRERGVVSTDRRRGTRVLTAPSQHEYRDLPVMKGELDLRAANPDPQLLPNLRPAFAAISLASGDYGGDHLDPKLSHIAQRMFVKDEIDATHLFVAGGAIGALQRALRATAVAGDKVAVEDPGFNEHHALVRSVGCTPVAVAVDDEGMQADSLAAALRGGVRAVLLTARCQSPTGAAITRNRAVKLREVLREAPHVAMLVDDYGALLCPRPVATPLGVNDQWMIVRSFNKVLAPDLRVAIAVGDAQTIGRMREQLWLGDGWVSPYLQRACAEALASIAPLRHAGRVYETRREALREALRGYGIVSHGASGLNVWIPVQDEAAVVTGLAAKGFHIRAGARYRLLSAPAVRITTARLLPAQAATLARAFAELMGKPARHAP